MGRAELVIRWELESLARLEGLTLEAERQGHDVTGDPLAAIRERRADLRKQAKTAGLSTTHWQPDKHAKDLAERHNRSDEHLDLLLLHQFVHGSHFATSQRHSGIDEEGVVLIGGEASNSSTWTRNAALSAAQSMLHAARAAYRLLDTVAPAELGEMLAEVESLADEQPDATSTPSRS